MSQIEASVYKDASTMARKRPREISDAREKLIEIYDDLANLDESVRFRAACSLITTFAVSPKANAKQLDEILKRLVRGLCSSRKAARLGFSVALTAFLVELRRDLPPGTDPLFHASSLLDVLGTQTDVANAASAHVSLTSAPQFHSGISNE